jgi:ABC-2 type transport system permease protein
MSAFAPIFKREFLGYFRTPIAYVFLTVFLVLSVGLTWYIGGFFESNDASLGRFFPFLPWVYLFLIPAVGMRLWSEEKRSGTWELLLTYPVTKEAAVLGKFMAGWAFIALAVTGAFPLALTVAWLGDPDWGPILAGYVGALLMAGAYLSVCAFVSALTRNQVIAFVLSLVLCLVLVFLGWSVFNDLLLGIGLPVWLVDGLANFSFVTHFEYFARGLVTLSDLLFFLILGAVMLALNVIVLER